MPIRWRDAMSHALYGPGGFFVAGGGPAAHFRTSVHASPAFATALLRLLTQVDAALGHPARLDVVDVGAGRGELLSSLAGVAVGVSGEPAHSGRSGLIPPWAGSPETLTPAASARALGSDPSSGTVRPSLAERVRFTAVEYAERPENLPEEINWVSEIPEGITGLLIATEWLDNVPLDAAVHTADGWRYVLVDPGSGAESIGELVSPADLDWLTTWWSSPDPSPGTDSDPRPGLPWTDATSDSESGFRAEIGRTRDEAWANAVGKISRGLALAVDYGHLSGDRPVDGTLTGYRGGRQVPPVPDGSSDVTAHVAMDSVASAGSEVARCAYSLVLQREALRALGADGGRPPLSLAGTDPAGYVRALAAASAVAELTDPAGLGGHWWLRQPVGIPQEPAVAR
ncbi:SAM-dependent MidA family methyltransferase [Micromonospora jinlongensis]|uniref:SAM-dependent MidA family methyltransferase n=1 Tax=Micromonospora jinlongensis TaxID=1287877 RepID=A0A7Y9X239_9ACTN|nr:SAM-dependent methyltransferase [Micromonospora jinlongensis]NYH43821.1 SAM-dependent MidA family methyltransferase [Micromonospora jinlongensis]